MSTSTVSQAAVAALFAFTTLAAQAQQTVKIAYIDPLSGPFANVGEAGLRQFQFAIEEINRRGLPAQRSSKSWASTTR